MAFWSLLPLLQSRVAASEKVDLVIAAVTPCIDSKDYCQARDWELCISSNSYLANCCWSCHSLTEIDEDDESCYSRGLNDIMSAAECAYAATQEGMIFIGMDSSSEQSESMPVGCSRLESSEDVYQWNPAQRADDYDPGDDPIRVCLRSRRPTANSNLRKYVPEYADIRPVMETYDYGDYEIRSLETAFVCTDIEPSCELVSDVETCSNIAEDEDLTMVISSDPYIPGGCFYYDSDITWNEGNGIDFPPLVTTAYSTHICRNCKSSLCPLPIWLWFVLVALGLIVCIATVCCCCFNFQASKLGRQALSGQPELNRAAPRIQNTEVMHDYEAIDNDQRFYYPDMKKEYAYRLSDSSWDISAVPMNLYNKPALKRI